MAWLKDAMADDALDASLIRFALAPIAQGAETGAAAFPGGLRCADVTEAAIRAEFAAGASLMDVQDRLKCRNLLRRMPARPEETGPRRTARAGVTARRRQ